MENLFKSLDDVRDRIEKNYNFILELQELIPKIKDDYERIELIALISYINACCTTGVYASNELEKYLLEIANKIEFQPKEVPVDSDNNKILLVMSRSYNVGGHTVIVNNWLRWDTKNKYSLVFTDQEESRVANFLKESLEFRGGNLYCLQGDYIEKANKLLEISKDYKAILLFTHMHDAVPILAYGNKNWNIPVFFYNHADYRFSLGFSIADKVLELTPYDREKSIKFRGIAPSDTILMRSPNAGNIIIDKKEDDHLLSREEKRELLARKYKFNKNDKLIISAGADKKFESVIGYHFDQFVDQLLERYDGDASFLIIGPNPDRKKWKNLYSSTNGKARVLGILSRSEMYDLIEVADLYIISFPEHSFGGGVARNFGVPHLGLYIINRGVDKFLQAATYSIDELIERSLEILHAKEVILKSEVFPGENLQEEWEKKWNCLLSEVKEHKIRDIQPRRYIETQEYLTCQQFQYSVSEKISKYIHIRITNTVILNKLKELNNKYDININWEK